MGRIRARRWVAATVGAAIISPPLVAAPTVMAAPPLPPATAQAAHVTMEEGEAARTQTAVSDPPRSTEAMFRPWQTASNQQSPIDIPPTVAAPAIRLTPALGPSQQGGITHVVALYPGTLDLLVGLGLCPGTWVPPVEQGLLVET